MGGGGCRSSGIEGNLVARETLAAVVRKELLIFRPEAPGRKLLE